MIDRKWHSYTLVSEDLIVQEYLYANMQELSYILEIYIYRHRPRRLLGSSQRICLFINMCSNIQIERDKMENILYTLVIGSIIYVIVKSFPK